MAKKRKKKILRYKKPVNFNLGVIIFLIIFVYFAIYLISYATQKHISVYEVQKGQIAQSSIYTGLILRSEQVIYTDHAGVVNYYAKEGDKAGNNDLICSVDTDGKLAEQISQAGEDGTQLDKESLEDVQTVIQSYSGNCSDMSFYNVYSLKNAVNSQVQESLYLSALSNLSSQTDEAVKNQTFYFQNAPRDGIVALYTDGYEEVTPDSFENAMFDPSSYSKNSVGSNQKLSNGQAIYKLVTNEDWYVMVPVNQETAKQFEDKNYVTVTFRKDGTSATPSVQVKKYDNKDYLVLKFNSSMVRYVSDRYIELELGTDTTTGLKIPNSSIIEKEFLVIPKTYFTNGGNNSTSGLLKVSSQKGKTSAEFIPTEQYYETETDYYIDESSLKKGDVIQAPDSSEQYTIKESDKLKGVYNINKGYAVFKQIDVVSQNKEYSILKTGTKYGLSLYDHIALNGSDIKEGELIH